LDGVEISGHKNETLFVTIHGSVSEPLHIVYVFSGAKANPLKTEIHAEKFSKAQIIESYVSEDGAEYATSSATNIVVKESAELHHFSFSFGGKSAHHTIEVDLTAPQALGSLDGLYVAKDEQHIEYHTVIRHNEPHTVSRQLYKGILDGEARAVFDGKIVVKKGAVFTDAAQLNKNLLLSKKAHVDTQPQLEIANNEVKCTHGATVGQINMEEVFYLQSRGIPKEIATPMLTHGFVDDVLNHLQNDEIKNWVGDLLERRFFRDAA
jgi:Fe-S cluster assembly protein SufD